jgi:alpha-tubulin suppressor-like RCC1 family protein
MTAQIRSGTSGALGSFTMTDYNPNDSKYAFANSPYIRISTSGNDASTNHFCAIDLIGALRCWGEGTYGKLGNDSTSHNTDPEVVTLGQRAKSVTTAKHSTCAVLDDGSVKCWGIGNYYQLGNGANTPVRTAGTALTFGSAKAVSIAATEDSYLVLLNNDSIGYWGNGYDGTLGQEGASGASTPQFGIDLGTNRHATQISAGKDHVCAVLDNASIKCWGKNSNGKLGVGDTTDRGKAANTMGDDLPSVYLGAGKTAKAVSAGGAFTCALLNDDSVRCWGYNNYGQLGNGTTDDLTTLAGSSTSVNFGGKTPKSIHAGHLHACAIMTDGSAMCWGYGNDGQLGQGGSNTSINHTPLAVAFPSGSIVKSLEASNSSTCASLDNSTTNVWCWGSGVNGSSGYAPENPPCSNYNTPCARAIEW